MRVRSFPIPLRCRAKFSDRALPSPDSNSFVFIDPRERREQPQVGESQISLFGGCNFSSARALLGMAPVVCLGVQSKLGRGGVQELRTHGARTQNDQLVFGYRSRLKTIIWLAVLLRNPPSQLVRFVDKRRVYEHFGQKAVTQRICAGARFSRPRARTGTPHRIAAICGDLLV